MTTQKKPATYINMFTGTDDVPNLFQRAGRSLSGRYHQLEDKYTAIARSERLHPYFVMGDIRSIAFIARGVTGKFLTMTGDGYTALKQNLIPTDPSGVWYPAALSHSNALTGRREVPNFLQLIGVGLQNEAKATKDYFYKTLYVIEGHDVNRSTVIATGATFMTLKWSFIGVAASLLIQCTSSAFANNAALNVVVQQSIMHQPQASGSSFGPSFISGASVIGGVCALWGPLLATNLVLAGAYLATNLTGKAANFVGDVYAEGKQALLSGKNSSPKKSNAPLPTLG